MDAESAIRRLSFAEAQHSSTEAMVAIARHRAEMARDVEIDQRTDAQLAEDLVDRARDAHKLDKTV